MRKISSLALFAFLMPLAGCPGDDSGETDTVAETANVPTTDTPTTDEPTTNEPTTNEPTTNEPTTDAVDSTTGGGGGAGFCGLTCESPADCAMGGNEADWECNDSFCEYNGTPLACDDTTCPAAIGGECADVNGNNVCTFPCTDGGGECDALMLECTGENDAGGSICQGPPCGGVAEGDPCDIPMFGQLGTCTNGVCSCTDDAECTPEGYACNS